jgi:hypothetical protein
MILNAIDVINTLGRSSFGNSFNPSTSALTFLKAKKLNKPGIAPISIEFLSFSSSGHANKNTGA